MFAHRRIALACALGAVAAAPGTAIAMPAREPVTATDQSGSELRIAEPSATPVVRDDSTAGDATLALILSGSALLIAGGAAAISTRDHRRLGRVA
jgi:hypothetical protein